MVDWESIRAQCVRTGEMIKIAKKDALPLPDDVHESDLGLSKRAIKQYRDESPTNSLHIHEFSDHFLVHVDIFNPEFHPFAHGVVDTPAITLATVFGAVGTFFIAKTLHSMSFLPEENKDIEY